jgi:hypothetical protein
VSGGGVNPALLPAQGGVYPATSEDGMDALERTLAVGGQIVIRSMRYLALSTGSRNDHQQDNP